MKVALVYDRLNKWGGAERVLLALHKIFPDAPLYTSIFDKDGASWAGEFNVKTSFLQSAKMLRGYNDLLALAMPIAFESFDFSEFDLVISVTSEFAKAIITKPGTIHICYCLTPTRYLWSGYDEYFRNPFFRFITKPAVSYLRNFDKVSAQRPDYYISISSEVKKRIKEYYNRDSYVIYPPVVLNNIEKNQKREDFFLLVSRFSRFSYYKKVDLAIEAFNKSGRKLKIVGGGPLISKYKSGANKNIEFLGPVTDEELSKYYQTSKALIFPGKEDFGLVMAEALSFGTPVIAYKAGGAIDIIKEGINGEFFIKQKVEDLIDCVERFDQKRYNISKILKTAEEYSFANFQANLSGFIKKLEI